MSISNQTQAVGTPAQNPTNPTANLAVLSPTLNAMPAPLQSIPLTDYGNAQRLVARYGRNLKWVAKLGFWLVWNDKRWCEDEQGEIMRYAKANCRDMLADAANLLTLAASTTNKSASAQLKADAEELVKHSTRSESLPRLEASIKLAQSEPGVPITHEALDQEHMLLNCLDGTIDLATGQLRSFDRDDLMTKMAPVQFKGLHEPANRWEQFIREITCGDADLGRFIQRVVGYCLTGSTIEQCFFLLHGHGANGKSTFVEVLLEMLADYGQQAEFATFLLKEGDKVRNDIARMRGARFVSASEGPEGRRLDEATIKALSGGDVVTARFLHKEFFQFKPTHKILLSSNYKPVIQGNDDGIWRRIRVIPFNAHFAQVRRDPHLKEKLRAEMPGILAWAVRGCLDWQQNGLGSCKAVDEAGGVYRREMDTIQQFIDECCEVGQNKQVQSSTLYKLYEKWAKANGMGVMSNKRLSQNLEQRGYTDKRTNKGTTRIGLDLKPIQDWAF
jgi:putative DNA primase/helicase